jgi:hypothetical protein
MLDVLFVALMIGFFALTWLFVKACERIIGPDVESERLEEAAEAAAVERAA